MNPEPPFPGILDIPPTEVDKRVAKAYESGRASADSRLREINSLTRSADKDNWAIQLMRIQQLSTPLVNEILECEVRPNPEYPKAQEWPLIFHPDAVKKYDDIP